jgi:cag pathogenicity island protein 24
VFDSSGGFFMPYMKYTRLSKEQLEELHSEFINFLATQSITGEEWDRIKHDQPEVAEQEIDTFSDLIWEGVLSNSKFLENISPQQLFLFKIEDEEINLIVVKTLNFTKNLNTSDGFRWLQENFTSDEVEFQTAQKAFSNDKNMDIFSLIKQGANITKGELYNFFEKILNAQ